MTIQEIRNMLQEEILHLPAYEDGNRVFQNVGI